jgi:SAM-dependent methyltransferase
VTRARHASGGDRLVTAGSGADGGRVWLVTDGVKRWILSPDVFAAHGWDFADVEQLGDAELAAIPTSPHVIGAEPSPEAFQQPRFRVSEPFLRGRGLEIGAGISPQHLPSGAVAELFELRDAAEVARIQSAGSGVAVRAEDVPRFRPMDEIPARFPDGADFLIAHNVLEHCADPIGTLLGWCAHVRSGGVIVLSVPHHLYCPDAKRLVADLEHVLADHLLGRDADHFESREHAYSCAAGWMNFWEDWLPLDRAALAARLHAFAAMPALDAHWHAFTPSLFDELLQATSLLAPRPMALLAWADPDTTDETRTAGDVIAVLRVGERSASDREVAWRTPDVAPRLDAFSHRLSAAADRLGAARRAQRSS